MTTIDARYRDASLPVDARVADLLARMTLDEKLAQLGSLISQFHVVIDFSVEGDAYFAV